MSDKQQQNENIEDLTLDELKKFKLQQELENLDKKVRGVEDDKQKIVATNPEVQNQALSSDDPAELYEKLKQKWGLQPQEPKEDQIFHDQQKTRLEMLLEERRNRKPPKLQQIQDTYLQQIQDDMVVKTEYSKDGPMPKTIEKMLTEYQGIKGAVNIGQEWTDIIQQGVKQNLKSQEQAANNYFWMMAKKGRLGVDGIAIAFGIFGIILVPVYFYQRQNRRRAPYKKEIAIVSGIKDWENSSLDIDDVSVQQTYYTLFQEEIQELQKKRMSVQQQISKLLGREK